MAWKSDMQFDKCILYMLNIDIHRRKNLEKYKCTTIKCKGHESIYLYIPRSPVPVNKRYLVALLNVMYSSFKSNVWAREDKKDCRSFARL